MKREKEDMWKGSDRIINFNAYKGRIEDIS